MFEKIKYIVSGFIGGLLLCLGFTWGKKNNRRKDGDNTSAGDIDLSGIADLVTERNNRNIERLKEYRDSLSGTAEENRDSQRIRELVSELRAEQQNSCNE